MAVGLQSLLLLRGMQGNPLHGKKFLLRISLFLDCVGGEAICPGQVWREVFSLRGRHNDSQQSTRVTGTQFNFCLGFFIELRPHSFRVYVYKFLFPCYDSVSITPVFMKRKRILCRLTAILERQ